MEHPARVLSYLLPPQFPVPYALCHFGQLIKIMFNNYKLRCWAASLANLLNLFVSLAVPKCTFPVRCHPSPSPPLANLQPSQHCRFLLESLNASFDSMELLSSLPLNSLINLVNICRGQDQDKQHEQLQSCCCCCSARVAKAAAAAVAAHYPVL